MVDLNLAPMMAEIFLALAGMTLLMLGVFQNTTTPEGVTGASRLTSRLGVMTLVLALGLVFAISSDTYSVFEGLFISDPFAVFAKMLILVAAALTLVMSQNWL